MKLFQFSKSGEKGKTVKKDFHYSSDINKDFLSINYLKNFLKNYKYEK